MNKFLTALLTSATCLTAGAAHAADYRIDHMEPPSWWAGMHDQRLQLMVHGERIADLEPALNYPGVRIAAVTRVANRNYLFIDLVIGEQARPGTIALRFAGGGRQLGYSYPLLAREPGSAQRKSFDGSDAIYEVMPDRFANGSSANDSVAAMADKLDRAGGAGRHGGDIQGIIDHLGYIAAMGFTQLWPTPLLENDMPTYSYHGYAATDHYRIDPRYGSNEDYARLSSAARKNGIGLIHDVVLSHIGARHWWMKDMPMPDWTNHAGRFVPNVHHRMSTMDPYGSQADKLNFTHGWFTDEMPDLNQNNPMVATSLIQNSIWWIEYAHLSGLRIDTYGYSDASFLTEYSRRVLAEYPRLNMVGEEWHKAPAVVAHWQRGKVSADGFTGSLPGMMDFPMMYVMRSGLARTEDKDGFKDVYELLSQDHLYPDPSNLVLFEGNHDVPRMFSVVGDDIDLYKMALVFTMTMPRIPQFYYGTEVLMTSTFKGRDDASYRHDFPGGWAGDKVNAFTGAGLTQQQRDAQAFVGKLVNWRKAQSVIHHGKMMQFGPENDTWVYFRYDDKKRVMVAFNKNATAVSLPTARFKEILKGARSGVDALTGKTFDLTGSLALPARSVVILEF